MTSSTLNRLVHQVPSIFLSLTLVTVCALASGCSTSYYAQAISGHISLFSKRQDIDNWLEKNRSSQDPEIIETSRKLRLVNDVRTFADDILKMPVGQAYSTYVPLKTNYVVWNVFAAPALNTDPLTWCYPVIGCAHYRGYYKESSALDYAATLEAKGYETYVAGVQAYSTLGWFNDPVLSTFLSRRDSNLASLLFHELAHRIAFAKDDTSFNESFATAFEQFALNSWVQTKNSTKQQEAYNEFLKRKESSEEFVQLVLAKRELLQEIYLTDDSSDAIKLTTKQREFENLRNELAALDSRYGYVDVYSTWAKALNNAKLVPVASYNEWVPAISYKLSQTVSKASCSLPDSKAGLNICFEGLDDFYREIKRIAKLNKKKREAILAQWQMAAEHL